LRNGFNLFSGYLCRTLCIDGYCAAFSRDEEPTACKRICGADSCKGAAIVKPCDLSAQFPGFTGEKDVNLNGYTRDLLCDNGMCIPIRPEGYKDSCVAICGYESCKNAVIPKPCNLELPDGETWICNASQCFDVKTLSCLVVCTLISY